VNGAHDMGGMHGMGAITPEANEPVFHEPWEGRVFALNRATAALGKWNIDVNRHSIERIRPADYLRMSYYEKWLAGLVTRLEESGLITRVELQRGQAASGSSKATPSLTVDQLRAVVPERGWFERPVNEPPRFAIGQAVRAKKINPTGHTRLPRYARGAAGVIDRIHGAHVFPDSNAHFQGECPQYLYSVRFAARELWGADAAVRDSVYVDLWESYLDPA
jgi:nitrile hydratase beta subunit